MAVNKRGRTDLQTEQDIEAFAAQAEKPMAPVTSLPKPAAAPSPAPASRTAPATPAASPAPKAVRSSPATVPSISPALVPAMADWKRRNREPKSGGINFRASASQLDLLRTAALVEEISQQKILERLVWPILEEKYGTGASE